MTGQTKSETTEIEKDICKRCVREVPASEIAPGPIGTLWTSDPLCIHCRNVAKEDRFALAKVWSTIPWNSPGTFIGWAIALFREKGLWHYITDPFTDKADALAELELYKSGQKTTGGTK